MRRKGGVPKAARLQPVRAAVARSIQQFSASRRNAIRGIVANARRGPLGSAQIDAVRFNNSDADMVAAATILECPGGLRGRKVTGLMQSDVPMVHHLKSRSGVLEAAYACGFLNAWPTESIMAFETIAVLGRLTEVPAADALNAIAGVAEVWGASSYLAFKISFMKEFVDLGENEERQLAEVERVLGHRQSPMLQYAALEILKRRLPLFSVARRHTNMLNDHVEGDFRRFVSLCNLVATPLNQADCGPFLLRGVESSLIDIARHLWVVVNLKDRLPDVWETIESHLRGDILDCLLKSHREVASLPAPNLFEPFDAAAESLEGEGGRSLLAYRLSVAFLEFPSICLFRHDMDRVIGQRLIAPLLPGLVTWHGDSFFSLPILKREDGVFRLSEHGTDRVTIDTFYRTYLFLRMIQDPGNLARLSGDDVQFIFNNTMGLEMLLLEQELKTMHINASPGARALVSLLALALYRSKSADPDIDFDFRANLEDYIIQNFGASIPQFIDSMALKSPQVANYILGSLDEVTLQKMYQIIDSPAAAEIARHDILTSVGIHLNRIEYIIEAEAIETRSKVAKLKNYFDASRMFVDSFAMKKWLSSNPSAFAEQYKEILPTLTARLAASKAVISSSGDEAQIDIFEITSTDVYLVEQMAKEAFREFCVNNEFGIESYLGRRIRHNTLHGVTTKSIDAVLQRPEYQPVIAGTPFGRALESWEASFKVFVERMRREFLQFRSDARPNALFNAEIDPSETVTKRNLLQLVQTLRVSGPEMLDELIISFCWRQIAPQLEFASRQIRVKMTQDMTQALNNALQRFNGPEELKVKSALEGAIASVFAQVASWFQVPQTGFVPASISEICNIIDIENGRSATPTIVQDQQPPIKYFGISVHRLYDCLAVLLGNAFKHGRSGSEVVVRVETAPIQTTNLHDLDVVVRSVLPEESASDCVDRVFSALKSSETGRDMVTEGYSGVKKVKFITRLNEGKSTVAADVIDEALEIRFRLRAEVVDVESDD